MKCALYFCCLAVLLCTTAGWPFSSGGGRNPFFYRRFWRFSRFPWGNYRQPWGFFTKPWGTKTNDCVDPGISLEEKLRINSQDNDNNNDGVVTTSDVLYDVTTNYDTNGDGVWTESECVKRWTCAYGDNTLVATYICNVILQGESNITISVFNNNPALMSGVPLDAFIQMNRARYEQFSNKQCVEKCLSVEEKLTRNAANNDNNRDGIVTVQDITFDLTNLYDDDDDGQVTKVEFVSTWVCNYGDTGDYARFIWNQFSQGAESVDIANLPLGPQFDTGVPLSDFVNNNRQNYNTFAKSNPRRDCVDSTTQQRHRFNF